MNSLFVWGMAGALIGGALGVLIGMPDNGPVLIAGDQPVTVEQVRSKLQTDGWTNLLVTDQGRYIEATGSKQGRAGRVLVDALSGRLADDDGD